MLNKSSGYPQKVHKRTIEALELLGAILFPVKCASCGVLGEIFCVNCAECLKNVRTTASGVITVTEYHNPLVRNVLWRLKYHGEKHVAKTLAKLLLEPVQEKLFDLAEESPLSREVVLVVPIPSGEKRKSRRGYNQAELLSSELAQLLGPDQCEHTPNFLTKIRETQQQARVKNKAERFRNLREAFAVPENLADQVQGKIVVVVDDISTTGATMMEAKRALKLAGARKVVCMTVAW